MVRLVNVPVGEPRAGETAPRQNGFIKNAKLPLTAPIGYEKCTTLYEFMEAALDENPNAKVMGSRKLIEVHEEIKTVTKIIDGEEQQVDKTWLYFEKGPYEYLTKKELKTLYHNYGRGLVNIGLKPGNVDKLHLFASTSAVWMQTFLAALSQAIPVVTAYDTLGEAGLTFSMVQTETSAIFTDNALIKKLVKPLEKATKIRYIIHSEAIDPKDKRQKGKIFKEANDAKEAILKVRPDIKFYSIDEVIALGAEAKDLENTPPKPEDIACIMFTSGSTGDPKGVVLSNRNILAGVGGVAGIIDRSIVSHKDKIIAFLPLAHIFELTFELIIFYWGGVIGYAGVKTLTDTSMKNCEGDMKEFQPTIMVAVAAVWETIKKGITAKIDQLPAVTQKIFWSGYRSKQLLTSFHLPGASIINHLLFGKIREVTGGKLRFVLNGGSPISVDTQLFISTLIAPMLLGYGLTETVANTSVLDPRHFELGCAGALSGAVEVKLVDAEELGYFAKNHQGEVWIKGAPVMVEYYKNEVETKKALTEDGWFKTGDIGEWTPTGQLKIIDRAKNLVKTLNGEYIALEKLESVYRSNPIVANVLCYADQSKVKPIAVVSPNPSVLEEFVTKEGLLKKDNVFDLEKVVADPAVSKAVTKSLVKQASRDGLEGIELILGVVLVDCEWTPENGYVSSAHKLQRKKILKEVEKQVDELYKGN